MWVGRGRYEVESCVAASPRRESGSAGDEGQEEEAAVRSQTENAVIMRFS